MHIFFFANSSQHVNVSCTQFLLNLTKDSVWCLCSKVWYVRAYKTSQQEMLTIYTCAWLVSYGFINNNNLQQPYKGHFHYSPVEKNNIIIILDSIHNFSYKCASWYSQSCKDCSERLTPHSDGSNVTGICSSRQGHHDVFVVKAPCLKCTWVAPSNPKESRIWLVNLG